MDDEHVSNEQFLGGIRKLYAGLQGVCLENQFWRVIVLPESNAKIVEMTFKPTGRNVVRATRAFNRFRYEEWVRGGEGPTAVNIMPYRVEPRTESSNAISLVVKTKDGGQLRHRVALRGDAVRLETTMTAGQGRTFDVLVHPEYDTGSASDDPTVFRIFVKGPQWVHANREWQKASPTDQQLAIIRNATAGGTFAYYNSQAKFGVEQTFDPAQFNALGLFWNPSRQQINLEMFPKVVKLEPGQHTRYGYEVRYLTKAPQPEKP
jgi:hypothetical protein